MDGQPRRAGSRTPREGRRGVPCCVRRRCGSLCPPGRHGRNRITARGFRCGLVATRYLRLPERLGHALPDRAGRKPVELPACVALRSVRPIRIPKSRNCVVLVLRPSSSSRMGRVPRDPWTPWRPSHYDIISSHITCPPKRFARLTAPMRKRRGRWPSRAGSESSMTETAGGS